MGSFSAPNGFAMEGFPADYQNMKMISVIAKSFERVFAELDRRFPS